MKIKLYVCHGKALHNVYLKKLKLAYSNYRDTPLY